MTVMISGMHRTHIVKTIREIISRLQAIGLNVIATVCDQSSANMSAIKYLIDATISYFTRKNEENRMLGFCVNDKEVNLCVPIFINFVQQSNDLLERWFSRSPNSNIIQVSHFPPN